MEVTRRDVMAGVGALMASAATADSRGRSNTDVEYGQDTLPAGIRSRRIDNNNGVTLHILEAGFENPGKPCIVLLHGFPELAYTWRKQLLPLAQAGFHVIAPDARGYGRSVTKPVMFDDDLLPYTMMSRVGDVIGLVRALGYEKVAAVVGHDWGAPTAEWCAQIRPDIFQSVVLMSTPFAGPPAFPLGTANKPTAPAPEADMQRDLAALPRPRKHYLWYHATPGANEDMWHAPQGVHDLLRALFHFKSADWKGNQPFPLKSWTAPELAKMPTYYIMDRDKGIAATMAAEMPSKAQVTACKWLTEAELRVYSEEFIRTGFQGGLNYYRIYTDRKYAIGTRNFSARTIDVPACFIGGAQEWGPRQSPGAFEAMKDVCTRLLSIQLVEGAGHSLGEEQPDKVNRLLVDFIQRARVV